MTKDESAIIDAVDAAARGVGILVFRAMYHIAHSGAPTTLNGVRFVLESDELAVSDHPSLADTLPTAAEETGLDQVVDALEREVKLAFLRMFLDKKFRGALSEDLIAARARMLADERSNKVTAPFLTALQLNPSLSTKELLRNMERSGELVEPDDPARPGEKLDHYLLRDGSIIKRAGITSKISRLRKRLRTA